MNKIAMYFICTVSIGALTGCGTNNSKQVSKKVATTKIDLLGNFKSESNGVYNLKGKTNPGAKVWYRYKVGSKTFKNSLLANKSGKFQIRVVNTSADQDTTNVEVDVKAKGLKQNYDVASIENHSSEFVSKRSKRYKLTSSDKAYLASSRVKASYDKKRNAAKQSSEEERIEKQIDNDSKKSNSTKSSYKSRYKSVSLDDFIGNPERYEGKNIKTSGTVSYIQRESDNNTMDYVVLNNSDDSAATITEIEVEDMHDNHITEGDNITVEGGGLTQTVKLHGKTLKSDIIVDSVIVN